MSHHSVKVTGNYNVNYTSFLVCRIPYLYFNNIYFYGTRDRVTVYAIGNNWVGFELFKFLGRRSILLNKLKLA